MQEDFHYYATYCAAYIAGYTHEESMAICYSAQFVDMCSMTYLSGIKAPAEAATTQLQLELANARTDLVGLQDMTRIWASFHFLPRDLYADPGRFCFRRYRNKYRLICGPNGDLVVDTVKLAKGKGLQAAGIAMHVLADTWAHQNFAGTPSLVINNTDEYFYELIEQDHSLTERKIKFIHSTSTPDDLENSVYTNSLSQNSENSIMNLGHGRAGHLPDYSFVRYKYLPAWGDFKEIIKDNPLDYAHAFTQMIYALKYLRGVHSDFVTDKYDIAAIAPWKDQIISIITKRQLSASEDWKAFGEQLSGRTIDDFDIDRYRAEYMRAADGSEKDGTFLGMFIKAAMAHKSMVTDRIYKSGNRIAGYSIEQKGIGFIRKKGGSATADMSAEEMIGNAVEDTIDEIAISVDETADSLNLTDIGQVELPGEDYS